MYINRLLQHLKQLFHYFNKVYPFNCLSFISVIIASYFVNLVRKRFHSALDAPVEIIILYRLYQVLVLD